MYGSQGPLRDALLSRASSYKEDCLPHIFYDHSCQDPDWNITCGLSGFNWPKQSTVYSVDFLPRTRWGIRGRGNERAGEAANQSILLLDPTIVLTLLHKHTETTRVDASYTILCCFFSVWLFVFFLISSSFFFWFIFFALFLYFLCFGVVVRFCLFICLLMFFVCMIFWFLFVVCCCCFFKTIIVLLLVSLILHVILFRV